MKLRLPLVLVVLLSLPALAQEYRIIIDPASGVDSLTKQQLSAVFLKKATTMPNGAPAVPVDQLDNASVRQPFSADVHKKSIAAVAAFWQQKIFSGRDVPPSVKGSDAEVVAFVKQTPHAIGYVSPTADVTGVKVIVVKN